MDAFWGPIYVLTGIMVLGIIVAGIGGWLDEEGHKEAAKVPMMLGTAMLGMGVVGIAGKLLGTAIEYLF